MLVERYVSRSSQCWYMVEIIMLYRRLLRRSTDE
jgi:hypothetical protein